MIKFDDIDIGNRKAVTEFIFQTYSSIEKINTIRDRPYRTRFAKYTPADDGSDALREFLDLLIWENPMPQSITGLYAYPACRLSSIGHKALTELGVPCYVVNISGTANPNPFGPLFVANKVILDCAKKIRCPYYFKVGTSTNATYGRIENYEKFHFFGNREMFFEIAMFHDNCLETYLESI